MSQLPCLKCFLSASEAPGSKRLLPQRSPHVPFLGPNLAASAVGLKYFGKFLGQEWSMKYNENLNFRFLMQKYLSFVPEIKSFKKVFTHLMAPA